MSNYSDDDIRRAAEIREWLVKQISDKEEEIERLRTTLVLVDSLLKQGSFKAAANLGPSPISSPSSITSAATTTTATTAPPLSRLSSPERQKAGSRQNGKSSDGQLEGREGKEDGEIKEMRTLKRVKDNLLLADAELSANTITITPTEGIEINSNTPPFKSFFLNRILEGMKVKDSDKVNQGQLSSSESLNYQVQEDNTGNIKKIVINNYREKERLNEIFNTCTWVFTRMIEKSGR